MKFRDWAQQIIYRIIDPVVHKLVKVGITPNIVTTTGLFFNIVSAVILIYGGIYGEKNDFSYIGWAGGVCRIIRYVGRTSCTYWKNEFFFWRII